MATNNGNVQQEHNELTKLLKQHGIKHRISGKCLFLKMSNYISLPEDLTASLVMLTTQQGYIILLEG